MKGVLFLGFAIVLFTACEKQEKWYTQESPDLPAGRQGIDTYNPVNDPAMKQKIVTELRLLDISKIISDLEELQVRTESISKNRP